MDPSSTNPASLFGGSQTGGAGGAGRSNPASARGGSPTGSATGAGGQPEPDGSRQGSPGMATSIRAESHAGVVRAVAAAPTIARSKNAIGRDPRKLRYDPYAARLSSSGKLNFEASKEDRLDPETAGELLHRVHVQCGIDREDDDVIFAFDNALWFSHTLNGGSMFQDGDAKLRFAGYTATYDNIKKVLGSSPRRFFRAYADEIREANKTVLATFDPQDPVSFTQHGQLIEVASKRGLLKFPDLAHDSADACLSLTETERAAIEASKIDRLASVEGGTAVRRLARLD